MDGFYFLGETSDVQKNYPRNRPTRAVIFMP